MVEWERPTYVWEIQSFLGLAGYYWRFVEGFFRIVRATNHPHKEECPHMNGVKNVKQGSKS